MSENTDPNSQPITSNPAEVDWNALDEGETRLPPPKPDPADAPDPDNAAVEGDDEPAKPTEAADDDPIGDDPVEGESDDDEPPEFWSKAKKEQWKKITDPELRAAIKEHVQEVSTGTARKLEENATKVRQAEERATAAAAEQERALAFFQQNGPMMAAIIEGEFSAYTPAKMAELANENPAEWARVKQAKEARESWLGGLRGHIQGLQKQVIEQRTAQEQTARVAEHGKLATEFPKEFGTPEAAKRTYDVLGNYLHKNGIPPERINQTFEAAIVKLVRKAYKYDQNLARAKEITNPKQGQKPASTTPTRVVPGARSGANPTNEAQRQAVERLRSGERLTPDEAALAFR